MRHPAIVLSLLALWPFCAAAQTKNPVTAAARAALERQSRNLTEAAEEMPADKYGYKPTPQQMSFGELMAHIARTNEVLCSKLAGRAMSAPPAGDNKKEAIVASVRASFSACSKDLGTLEDAALGQSVLLFGNREGTKAEALLALTADWANHYGAAAIYLRLNGLLPPTAKK
jgi:uncharacterized damage-inducible protein DinB